MYLSQNFSGGVVAGVGEDKPGSWLVTEVTAELKERTIWLSVSLPDTINESSSPQAPLEGAQGLPLT